MTLEEMGQRMSAWEFGHHFADYQRFPWGEDRADLRSGLLAATMVNLSPYRKKGSPPAQIKDYLLFAERQRDDGTHEDIKEFILGNKSWQAHSDH